MSLCKPCKAKARETIGKYKEPAKQSKNLWHVQTARHSNCLHAKKHEVPKITVNIEQSGNTRILNIANTTDWNDIPILRDEEEIQEQEINC